MTKRKLSSKTSLSFVLFILFSLIFILVIQPTLAGPLETLGKFTSCSAGGILGGAAGPYISNLVNEGINKLKGMIPGLKSLPGLGAVPTEDVKLNPRYQGKELIQDVIARCTAREVLIEMNNNILKVVRTGGRDGGVTFVRSWRDFMLQGQYRGEDIWRGILYVAANGTDTGLPPLLCKHIRESQTFKSLLPRRVPNLIQSGPDQFQRRVDSLQDVLTTLKCNPELEQKLPIYKEDFVKGGGWDTFAKLLSAQNRSEGVAGILMNELEKQRAIEEKADTNEAIAGSGFTSTRGTDANDSCTVKGLSGKCIVYKTIKTPGSVILGGVNATVEQELAWIVSTDEVGEVIASAVQILFNRLLDLSNPNEGDYLIPGRVEYDPATLPPPDEGKGGGRCVDTGEGSPDYTGALRSAITAVINANPGGIADALNTAANGFIFLDYAAAELQGSGYNATTDVLNGNDNPNTGDLIAVWRSGDTTMERYDAIGSSGAGDTPLRDAWGTDYTGDIPLSCASGGGGGETPPEQPPAP